MSGTATGPERVEPVAERIEPVAERVALVTGASRGIGQAAAVALGRCGVRCVLLARTVGGLEHTDSLIRAAGGPAATLLPLDLVDGAAIDAIGPSLARRFGRLDLLVHAAGHAPPLTPVSHLVEAEWSRSIAINLTAGWRLLRTATPLLAAAPDARAVLLAGHRDGGAFWGALAAAGTGLDALARCWALENPAIRLILFDPGPTATRFRAACFPGEDRTPLGSARTAGERIAELACG